MYCNTREPMLCVMSSPLGHPHMSHRPWNCKNCRPSLKPINADGPQESRPLPDRVGLMVYYPSIPRMGPIVGEIPFVRTYRINPSGGNIQDSKVKCNFSLLLKRFTSLTQKSVLSPETLHFSDPFGSIAFHSGQKSGNKNRMWIGNQEDRHCWLIS